MAKILIIDDEERNRRLYEILMTANGYDVITEADGPKGIQVATSILPDLIILDVMMPQMDGFEVARFLKTDPLTKSIPIVVASSLDDVASQKRMWSIGVNAFLVKPVDRWELSKAVANLLQLRKELQGS